MTPRRSQIAAMSLAVLLVVIILAPEASADPVLGKLAAPSTGLGFVTDAQAMAWNPDEVHVAYADGSGGRFAWYNVSSSGVFTKLTNPVGLSTRSIQPRGLAWSPDGSILIAATDSLDSTCIRVFYRNGDTLTPANSGNVTSYPCSLGITSVDWRPNNASVAFGVQLSPYVVGYQVSGTGLNTVLTRWADFSGLATNLGSWQDVRWSHDSNHLAAAGASAGTNGRLFVINATSNAWVPGASATLDTTGNQVNRVSWDINDTLIAYTFGTTGQGVGFYNASVGGTITALTFPTSGVGNTAGSTWDATGQFIAICGGTSPFLKTYKKTGSNASATFNVLADPASAPEGQCTTAPQWTKLNTYLGIGLLVSPWEDTYTTNASFAPPAAPVLSGVIIPGGPGGQTSFLTWTTPPSSGLLGYNLTRVDEFGVSTIYQLGLVNSYSEPASSGNRSWNVTSWSGNGTSVSSNVIVLKEPAVPFFGTSGALFGGNEANTAAAWSIGTGALEVLYGLLITLFFSAAGFVTFGMWGAAGGAFAGFLIAIGSSLFPVWVVVFVLVVGAAVLVLALKAGGGRRR